ncbi:MAG TPA: CTP synthase [Ktedonobacterales bacterium]|jgi:CTP synthase (UTP-ammonia lyase)
MKQSIRIGLIGDFSPHVKAHYAIPRAIELALSGLDCQAEASWLSTPLLEKADAEETLAGYDALWCVPGSPYESMDGALRGIQFARERHVPFLGTCGGFQHAIIEYARNALGLAEADHAESNPDAAMLLMAPLTCSLVEQGGAITFRPGSRIATIYNRLEAYEQYHCSYGLNPGYQSLLEQGGIEITGWDSDGEARVFELPEHPFFIGTLFQPERSALNDVAHPLIRAFLEAASAARAGSASTDKKQQPTGPRINKIRSQPRSA